MRENLYYNVYVSGYHALTLKASMDIGKFLFLEKGDTIKILNIIEYPKKYKITLLSLKSNRYYQIFMHRGKFKEYFKENVKLNRKEKIKKMVK